MYRSSSRFRLLPPLYTVLNSSGPLPYTMPRTIVCVSAEANLALTRELLLTHAGYNVISTMETDAEGVCASAEADLLLLGHSVSRQRKQELIEIFRRRSTAPVVSLLRPFESKLPEADVGVPGGEPDIVLATVRKLLAATD